MSGTPITVSRPFGRTFVEYGRVNERTVCLTNDLTKSCEVDDFREAFPERHFSFGMAEQNLIGVMGGMAREGLVPFFPTFGVFATRRPYEQVALSIAYPALRARLIGFLPGLSTPGGATHQSIDDIGLMRQLPNMTVLEMGDATEIETLWPVLDQLDGPVYCRMLRGEVVRLFESPLELGRARRMTDGHDVAVLTSGLATQATLSAIEAAQTAGIDVAHWHVATLKPFDDPALLEAIGSVRFGVVTVENHLATGGLGTAVAEAIAENGLGCRLIRVAINNTFSQGGSRDYLFEAHGVGPRHVLDAIGRLVGQQHTVPLTLSTSTTTEELSTADADVVEAL